MSTSLKLTANALRSYKIGTHEIAELDKTLRELLRPVARALRAKMYWTDSVEVNSTEYKSHDGFIPHKHNLGGAKLHEIIPKCEEYNFGFLEFGECETCDGETACGDHGDCAESNDGLLDASLRIWFKLEHVDVKTGEMRFWIYMGGGNGDAPYFRSEYESEIYSAEFSAFSIDDLKRRASKPIGDLVRIIKK